MADISLPVDKTIILWWRHEKPDYLTKALDRNYPIVLCPRIPLYFDFVQHESHQVGRRWAGAYCELEGVYQFNAEQYAGDRTQQVLGVQANLWTEHIKTLERLDFMTVSYTHLNDRILAAIVAVLSAGFKLMYFA